MINLRIVLASVEEERRFAKILKGFSIVESVKVFRNPETKMKKNTDKTKGDTKCRINSNTEIKKSKIPKSVNQESEQTFEKTLLTDLMRIY